MWVKDSALQIRLLLATLGTFTCCDLRCVLDTLCGISPERICFEAWDPGSSPTKDLMTFSSRWALKHHTHSNKTCINIIEFIKKCNNSTFPHWKTNCKLKGGPTRGDPSCDF